MHTWTVRLPVDTTPPDTRIDAGPADPTTDTGATFAFSASEPATFTCSLDGAAFTPCTSPVTYTGLAVQAHAFRVLATDRAGLADPIPAARAWTVTAPPTCAGGTVTLSAAADAWVSEKDPAKNFGSDGILTVRAKNREAARGLVRFDLPAVPAGCTVVRAELVLHNSSGRTGRSIQVQSLGAPRTESAVTWQNQPPTTGGPAAAPSASARCGGT